MNNRGFVVAFPLNHCSLFKQYLICYRKNLYTMDVLPFVIFTMLLLIIIYLFVWYTVWLPLICRMLWLLAQWNASADNLLPSPFLSQSCWSTYSNHSIHLYFDGYWAYTYNSTSVSLNAKIFVVVVEDESEEILPGRTTMTRSISWW